MIRLHSTSYSVSEMTVPRFLVWNSSAKDSLLLTIAIHKGIFTFNRSNYIVLQPSTFWEWQNFYI